MRIPPFEIVLLPYFLDDSQSKYLRIVLSKCTLTKELPSSYSDIVFKELNQCIIEVIFLEYDSAGQVEIQKGYEGGMLHLEVHSFKDAPLGLLVLLLAKRFFGVTLITIKVWNVLIKLNGFSSNNQSSTTPKFLARIHPVESLIDVQPQSQGLVSEQKFIANRGQEMKSLFTNFFGLDHFRGRFSKAIQVVTKVKMKRSCVFVCLYCLIFVAVQSALQTLEGGSKAVLAAIDFSILVHFSIKIIKQNQLKGFNSHSINKCEKKRSRRSQVFVTQSTHLSSLLLQRKEFAIGYIISFLSHCKLRAHFIMKLLILLLNQLIYLIHLHVILLNPCLIGIFDPQHPLRVLNLIWSLSQFELLVVDCRLRLVFSVHRGDSRIGADSISGRNTFVFKSRLQNFSAPLFFEELLPRFIAESYQSMYSLHFDLLPVLLLLLPNQGLFMFEVVIIVGMIEFVHLVGSPMRIVPNEFFRFVKISVFQELFGLLDGVGEDGLKIVVLNS